MTKPGGSSSFKPRNSMNRPIASSPDDQRLQNPRAAKRPRLQGSPPKNAYVSAPYEALNVNNLLRSDLGVYVEVKNPPRQLITQKLRRERSHAERDSTRDELAFDHDDSDQLVLIPEPKTSPFFAKPSKEKDIVKSDLKAFPLPECLPDFGLEHGTLVIEYPVPQISGKDAAFRIRSLDSSTVKPLLLSENKLMDIKHQPHSLYLILRCRRTFDNGPVDPLKYLKFANLDDLEFFLEICKNTWKKTVHRFENGVLAHEHYKASLNRSSWNFTTLARPVDETQETNFLEARARRNSKESPKSILDAPIEMFDHFRRSSRRTTQTRSYVTLDPSPPPAPKAPKVNLGPKWEHEVIFQPTPKLRAVIDWEDLDRLNEDELLNDNLIEFYLKWLQTKNQSHKESIYFFSTHFYTKLVASMTKGRIDHKAIERWTKGANIFTFDYVVVPICDKYHWFLAVICNLPNLKRSPPSPSPEPIDLTDQASSSQPTKDPSDANIDITQSLDTPIGKGSSLSPINNGVEKMQIDPVIDLTSSMSQDSTSNTKRSTARRQPKKPPPPPKKHNLHLPTIVILDSLKGERRGAINNLKKYLVEEYNAKRDVKIEPNDIIQFHARQDLPEQRNGADCGLFMCGYVIKLLQDPMAFSRKLFRHENPAYWGVMDPSQMRNDIRNLLQDLYKEQHAKRIQRDAEKRQEKLAKRDAQAKSKPASSDPTIGQSDPSSHQIKSDSRQVMIDDIKAEPQTKVHEPQEANVNDDEIVPETPSREITPVNQPEKSPAEKKPDNSIPVTIIGKAATKRRSSRENAVSSQKSSSITASPVRPSSSNNRSSRRTQFDLGSFVTGFLTSPKKDASYKATAADR